MQTLIGSNRGAALPEQIISVLLGAVVITALYGFHRSQLYNLLSQETKTVTLEETRGALDIMARDLRNAGSWGTGEPPSEVGGIDDPDRDADSVCNRVYAATNRLIHIQMDLNGNGSCADTDPRENIRYEITGPTSTCPGPYIIRRNGDCLVGGIVTPEPGKLFTFYDAENRDLGDSPPLSEIKRVKIAFAVQLKSPDPKTPGHISSPLSTSVGFRN